MTFQAPDLTTTIDAVNYQNQIDSNFSSIDLALKQIQSELNVAQPNQGGSTMLGLLDAISIPNGVVGTDSFQLSFATDEESLSIVHSPNMNKSIAVINSRYFQNDNSFSVDLRTLVPSDGTFRIAVGLQDQGTPNVNIIVAQSDGDTGDEDESIDLLLWDFDYTKSGSVYTITNLRRRAVVIISRESFEEAHQAEIPITANIGTLPSTPGRVEQGVLVPWDCEIKRAFLRLGTAPTDSAVTDPTVEVDLIRTGFGTDADTVIGSAFWSDADAGLIRELTGFVEPLQVVAGDFIQPDVIQADSDGAAADLSITVLVKRIYHAIF
jgi:hypothetical protein